MICFKLTFYVHVSWITLCSLWLAFRIWVSMLIESMYIQLWLIYLGLLTSVSSFESLYLLGPQSGWVSAELSSHQGSNYIGTTLGFFRAISLEDASFRRTDVSVRFYFPLWNVAIFPVLSGVKFPVLSGEISPRSYPRGCRPVFHHHCG
jgi:hypothetical protein